MGISPKKFTVVIDPGHGGKDPGIVTDNGLKESNVVLDIAKLIKKYSDRSINVILLREKDEFMSLYNRMKMTMNLEPDLFISLHLDSSTGGYSDGWSIYYSPFYDWAYQSAQVGEWFKELLAIRGNGPRFGPDQAPFKILQETYCPSVMLSLGYLDNPLDQQLLTNDQEREELAKDLLAVICEISKRIEITLPKVNIEDYKKQTRNHISFSQPVSQKDISSPPRKFTKRRMHPILKVMRPHTGIDIIAKKGTEVLATNSGVVSEIKENRSRSGYGTYILIDHQNGYSSFYAHLDKILIEEGQKVTRNQPIGHIGQTGLAMEPHLHFEIREAGKPSVLVNRIAHLIERNLQDPTGPQCYTIGIYENLK